MSGAATLDLSQPFHKAVNYNANTASCALDGQFARNTRGYALLHGGKLLAQNYKEGYSNSSRFVQWSVTKSWTCAAPHPTPQTTLDLDTASFGA